MQVHRVGEADALLRPGAVHRAAGAVVAERLRHRAEAHQVGLELEADTEADRPAVRLVPTLGKRRPGELERTRGATRSSSAAVQAGDRPGRSDAAHRRHLCLVEGQGSFHGKFSRAEERRVSPDRADQRVCREGLLAKMRALRPIRRQARASRRGLRARAEGRSRASSPSGPAISSAKKRPIERPSIRRTSSPQSQPNVSAW